MVTLCHPANIYFGRCAIYHEKLFFLIVCHPGLKLTYLSLMNSCHNGIWASGAVWLSFKQTNVPFLQPGSVGSEHIAFPR